MSDPLTSLVKKIDQAVDAASPKAPNGRRFGTFLIIGDGTGRADQLRDLAKKENVQRVSFCIGEAPPRYEVNKDADLTVVIYNPGRPGKQSVQANFALRKDELDKAKAEAIVPSLTLPTRHQTYFFSSNVNSFLPPLTVAVNPDVSGLLYFSGNGCPGSSSFGLNFSLP